MFSKIWVINFLLMISFVVFGVKSYGVWSEGGEVSPEVRAGERPKPQSRKRIVARQIAPESAFGVVVDKNIFTPDRARFEPEEEDAPVPVAEDVKVSGKKILLYGVIITDDYKAALVTDPGGKSGKRRTMWVKPGDNVGEFNVSGIREESIVLREGSMSYEVLLYDTDKSRVGSTVAKKESRPTVVSAPAKKSEPEPTVEKKKTVEGKYETVITPFGKYKRRVE